MLLKEIYGLIALFGVLSVVNTSPIRVWQRSDSSDVLNRTVETLSSTINVNGTAPSSNSTFSSPIQSIKRAPMTLYVTGCTSVLNKSLGKPAAVRKPGPYFLSPQGGLYLTHRYENAEAMARIESTNCLPITINGFVSKFMITSYEFDDSGLHILDLDDEHWKQPDYAKGHLPTWWNDQSLRIIPHAGPDLQNEEMYNRYLSSHVVIGTLTPAANYGPGLTDLWTLWVLKRVQNDPIDPISRLNLVGIKHYIQ
ncbi:hypothetical protein F5051DRAFT_408643 [Lentinula edodes]|uniref:Uncharacterized protein n=1 Tax=Lentinula lateritia TaxID=40482 RepID=A0A9W9DPK7_9AGAR|nr:hypothetical protein F5051DRAFT_408643 [Lentinula edodes]KAJ4478816.1 hypothetical protein C8J55DRAFT_514966 [Lentinula edodes]